MREASNGLGLTLSCPPLPRAAEGELTRSAGVGELRLSEETDIVGESLADALHDTMVVAVPTGRGMNTGDRFGHGFAFTGAALLLERRIRSRSGARGDIANARRWSTGPQPHRGRHVEAAVGMQHQDLAEAVDTVMKLGMNHPMGPLALADLIGLDTCVAILDVLHDGLGDPKYRACPLLKKYVAAGWLGRKSGRGFFNYQGE